MLLVGSLLLQPCVQTERPKRPCWRKSMKALCTSSSSGIHCCYITYPLQQWVNFFIAGLFTVTAVTKHFFLPWTSLANFKCTQAFTFPSAFLHDWAIFLYSSITPYPCFCLLYIIFFFLFGLSLFLFWLTMSMSVYSW